MAYINGKEIFFSAVIGSSVTSGALPVEVSTEEEMTALLETAAVGSVYKYTGETTDTYTNGELYIVEEVSE